MVQPSTVNGTELVEKEWRDALFLWYVLYPPYLPKYCDGCNAKFKICHVLNCNRGGLVTARHNELWDGVIDLASKAFTPSHMRDNPLIFAGCTLKRLKANPSKTCGSTERDGAPPPEAMEQKEDLLIRELGKKGTDSAQDMRVVNTDAKTHSVKTPENCLQEAERGKKQMYLKVCIHQCRHFSPFVASVDRFLGLEVKETLKRLVSLLATKWRQPYSKTYGYAKIRITINLVRVTHHCIQVSRMPSHRISIQRTQWEDGSGLNLFR